MKFYQGCIFAIPLAALLWIPIFKFIIFPIWEWF